MPTQHPLLESAVASLINQHDYSRTDNVFYLAAVLAQKIMLNHSFSDGDKHISVAAADKFLRLNGYYSTPGGGG
ncbi:DOC family protein [Diaporthe helianthi]|uniref:DOC family protein n=1 Tax=Diaporthe helianthi TaxID=158607 RepID=A0A2P5HEQ7_DIAHE|nr:DOC family protein [Diaporthe helianthi]